MAPPKPVPQHARNMHYKIPKDLEFHGIIVRTDFSFDIVPPGPVGNDPPTNLFADHRWLQQDFDDLPKSESPLTVMRREATGPTIAAGATDGTATVMRASWYPVGPDVTVRANPG